MTNYVVFKPLIEKNYVVVFLRWVAQLLFIHRFVNTADNLDFSDGHGFNHIVLVMVKERSHSLIKNCKLIYNLVLVLI